MKIISLIGDKREALPFKRPKALLTSKMDRKVCTGKGTNPALTKHSYKNTITQTYLLQTRA